MPSRQAVLAALDTITDPKTGRGLASADLVQGLVVAEDRVGFVIEVAATDAAAYAPVRDAADAVLQALPGVTRVSVVLTSSTEPPSGRKAALSPQAVSQSRPRAPSPSERPAHVRRVLAIASGKGGVGKSTMTVHLAAALASRGLSVGILDADVHGPSIPTMLGLSGKPDYRDGAIVPHDVLGLKAMSVGLLTQADDAMVWRGPMASQALTQMLIQTRWGSADKPLDILVVDLPPGTGDIQLTLIQKTPLDGAVIVTTPQEVALADARRAYALFRKVGVPVLGLIENMTGEVFGKGGGEREAGRLSVPYLGDVPLDPAIRQAADTGRTVSASSPGGRAARSFDAFAAALERALDLRP